MEIRLGRIILLATSFWWTSILAAERPRLVWSYTMQEMYEMATYFKEVGTGREIDDIRKHLKAAEFKGYVAAILDNSNNANQELMACATKYPINDIAMRTAIIITSVPLDRSHMSGGQVHLAIVFACDDSGWKKQK